MEIEEYVQNWVRDSDDDFGAMMDNYKIKQYKWALYIGHLSVEKLFKALLIQKTCNKEVPHIHNLIRLALKCGLELTTKK